MSAVPVKLVTFRHWAPAQRRFFLQALVVVPAIAVGVRAFGVSRVSRLLGVTSPAGGPFDPPAAIVAFPTRAAALEREHRRVMGLAHPFGAAARVTLPRASCLERSLALWWLFDRRGLATDFRIGVRRRDGAMQAHAWIEHHGAVVADDPAYVATFAPFEGLTIEHLREPSMTGSGGPVWM